MHDVQGFRTAQFHKGIEGNWCGGALGEDMRKIAKLRTSDYTFDIFRGLFATL